MKHLPIELSTEERKLEQVLSAANQIASSIRKNLKMDVQAVDKLLKEYQKCPVLISEAENLYEKCENSKKLYDSLKLKLKSIMRSNDEMNYDQLTEVADQLEDVSFDFEGDLAAMKANVYSLRVHFLHKLAESFAAHPGGKKRPSNDQKETFTIGSQVIKLLAREGRELSENLKNQPKMRSMLDEAIALIGALLQKVEDKVKEINSVTSLETLDQMPQVLFGFIDLSQSMIEKKANLSNALLLSPNQTEKGLPSQISSLQRISCQNSPLRENSKIFAISPKSVDEIPNPDLKNANKGNNQKLPIPSRSATGLTQNAKPQATSVSPIAAALNQQENSLAINTIRGILHSCQYLHLSQGKSLKIAQNITQSFPLIKKSTEKRNKFAGLFNHMLKYPGICSNLAENSFRPQDISKLLGKTPKELLQLNKAFSKARSQANHIKDAVSNERYDDSFIRKKKVKNELNSPIVNIADGSSNLIHELPKLNTSKDPRLKYLLRAPLSPAPTDAKLSQHNERAFQRSSLVPKCLEAHKKHSGSAIVSESSTNRNREEHEKNRKEAKPQIAEKPKTPCRIDSREANEIKERTSQVPGDMVLPAQRVDVLKVSLITFILANRF